MAKRGRRPKGDYSGKSVVFTTRITPDTKIALQKAAAAKGRSVSQEAERRLRQSFEDEASAIEEFVSVRNRAVMKVVSMVVERVRRWDRPDADWKDDPYLFDIALKAIHSTLSAMRPPGEVVPPTDPLDERIDSTQGDRLAAEVWSGIISALRDPPLETTSRKGLLAARLKSDLEGIVDRVRVFTVTASGVVKEMEHPAKRRKSDAR